MGTRIILSRIFRSILTAPTNNSTCLPIPRRSSYARRATIQWNVRKRMHEPTVMCTVLQLHFSLGCADDAKVVRVEVPGGAGHLNASSFNSTTTTIM